MECNDDWLIDYADGALPDDQRALADEHLASCAACRSELTALQASGQKLHSHFAALRAVPTTKRRSQWTLVAQRSAIAACLALVAIGYAISVGWQRGNPPQKIAEHVADPPTIAVPSADDDVDVLAEINRQAQIARLRATIAILADQPGMSERRELLEKYLSEAYQVEADVPSM